MLRRIRRDQVRLGMFIHGFDGPWIDHPFWLPRFRLTSPDDLAKVRESSLLTLVIDETRGEALGSPAVEEGGRDASASGAGQNDTSPASPAPVGRQAAARASAVPLDEMPRDMMAEMPDARRLVVQSTREMKRLFHAVRQGQGLSAEEVVPMVAQVSASLSRNGDALVRLTRLKSRDEYTYVHSIAVSALMMKLGGAIGLERGELVDLGLAGLLHDIGKMIVPGRILNKPASLTDDEFALIRTHPEQGYRLLSDARDMPPVVLDVCRHHHERLDGSGYPMRLSGDDISIASRIAAICDVYDALTSDRVYKRAWAPEEAIGRMHRWEGHFDRSLLFTFMKAIGVFPHGLLVSLRSRRLAVVMPNRPGMRPMARAFYAMGDRKSVPLEDVFIGPDSDELVDEEDPADWQLDGWSLISEQLISGINPVIARPRPRLGEPAWA